MCNKDLMISLYSKSNSINIVKNNKQLKIIHSYSQQLLVQIWSQKPAKIPTNVMPNLPMTL